MISGLGVEETDRDFGILRYKEKEFSRVLVHCPLIPIRDIKSRVTLIRLLG